MSRVASKPLPKTTRAQAQAALAATPPRQAERKAGTKARILDAACKLMSETDFGSTTIDMIMEAAGMGRATFYLHFTNKSDVVEEAALQVKAKILGLAEELAACEHRDEAAVVEWMRRLVGMLIEQRIYLHVMTQFVSIDSEMRLGGDQWHMLIIETLARTNKTFALVLQQPNENRVLTARAHLILFALERFINYNVLEGAVPDSETCVTLLGQDLYRFMELA